MTDAQRLDRIEYILALMFEATAGGSISTENWDILVGLIGDLNIELDR